MPIVLTRNWWLLALRGVAAIVFGALAFAMPLITLTALVLLFGAYAFVDGVFNVVAAVTVPPGVRRWWPLLIEGIVSIAAGVLTFFFPAITALGLLFLIAAWAVVTGVFEIAAAVRLRKAITGEWLLLLSGILSVLFGMLLFLFPGAGALAVVWWIGAYAIVFGAMLLGLAFKLRSLSRAPSHEAVAV
jgi:uncharacterized membrane protein HdeD (DUF308 family)